MSDDSTQQGPVQPEREMVELTVEVPAHRVEQFRRLHQRFLAIAAHWDAKFGNEDLYGRGPWGRRGRHRHHRCGRWGHEHGRHGEFEQGPESGPREAQSDAPGVA